MARILATTFQKVWRNTSIGTYEEPIAQQANLSENSELLC